MALGFGGGMGNLIVALRLFGFRVQGLGFSV